MWLLSTDRAELHYFSSPEAVANSDGYAILSHVWDSEEQSFQDIQALTVSPGTSSSPRDRAKPKIRECCKLAEKHGHKWIWIDTCCIDKTSSAELSEAINSMFRYYALSDVCYAFLGDVGSDDVSQEWGEALAFRNSRWHSRGWTLQELIAPSFLLFVSLEWEPLGTKADLASLLSRITNVPELVLTQEQDFTEICIAQRMSWAANRQTSRVEDRAYSLFGIFGITLPTLYGEGNQAFQRLQEEILRCYTDTSLFVWQHSVLPGDELARFGSPGHQHVTESYLFAPSPSDFLFSSRTELAPCRVSAEQDNPSLQRVVYSVDISYGRR
jgi:hypothetical protein